MEQNRQFGRASRPAESGALIAGRTYKKRVGAGRARQAAMGFAKLPTPRPDEAAPFPTKQDAPPTTLVPEALLDAVALAIAEPVATQRTASRLPSPEAPLVAIPPSETGDATLPEALEVKPPIPQDRVEAPRPTARRARKSSSLLLRTAIAASVAGAGVIGYAHLSNIWPVAPASSPTVKADLSASPTAEARPAPIRAAAPALIPTEVTTLAPSALAQSGADRNGIVETAALAPTESVTAHPVANPEKVDTPLAPAPVARVAPPRKPEKPTPKQVAAAKSSTEIHRNDPRLDIKPEPRPAPKPDRSRGAILDFFSDVTDLIP